MKNSLTRFDELWTKYERNYVFELMVIESDSRRHILEAIKYEQELNVAYATLRTKKQDHSIDLETLQNSTDPDITEARDQILKTKTQLAIKFGQINSIANNKEKGRDDLTVDILMQA